MHGLWPSSAFPASGHKQAEIRTCLLQVMLGVDRLDMIKGIPQKLLAFEKFLEEHPEWRDKVLLVQIAVPSRTDVPEYQVGAPKTPSDSNGGRVCRV